MATSKGTERNRNRPFRRLRALLAVCGLICFAILPAFEQAEGSDAAFTQQQDAQSATATSTQTQESQTPIRVESNVVLVPVFVYDPARMAKATEEELPCARATVVEFFKLRPTEPYLPKDCDVTEVHGLGAGDFRLFEDGAEQQIGSFEAGVWRTVVRDNLGWHLQFSDTPAGIWSLSELSSLKKVPIVSWDFQILGYVPRNAKAGCHHLRVEVNRPKMLVFARDEYCTGQSPADPLFMTGRGKELERVLGSDKRGKIPLSVQAAAFYTSGGGENQARVDISLHFPPNELYRKWDSSNWTLYARIAVMGVIRRKDGTVAARFSDLIYPSYWPTFDQGGSKYIAWAKGTSDLSGAIPRLLSGGASTSKLGSSDSAYGNNTLALTFRKAGNEIAPDYTAIETALNSSDPFWMPTRYETQVGVPPGDYALEVVLNDGWKTGRAEVPVTIEPYSGEQLGISSVALCKRLRDAAVASTEATQANFSPGYVPLTSQGITFTPAGDTNFARSEAMFAYFEVYEPLLLQNPAASVKVHMRIIEASTGKVIEDFAPVSAAGYGRPGSAVLRIARKVPVGQLARGAYRLEVQATDSAGQSTAWRAAKFAIE